ncbi:hypothetical protein RF11_01796 [Thelohanellus kitauei]|uniref:Uncharacterized protein n=1 Tax=Thelohanellus kitauei TaxID=669202 RepID=A0A0C2J8P2_THEKT|nr:hypothetical protein RF11_01796 [Thelohanellus kitauei]
MKEDLEICRYHSNNLFYSENHPTVSLFTRGKLMFVDLDSSDKMPTMFSSEFQLHEKIYSFKSDKFKKCMYLLVREGIMRKCYGSKIELNRSRILIIQDHKIKGMDLDPSNHYLYYYDKHQITVTDLKTLVKSTIYSTPDSMYFMKVDMIEQHIYVSYITKDTEDVQVIVLTVYGLEIMSFAVGTIVQEIYYTRHMYMIYTYEGVFQYSYGSNELVKIENPHYEFQYLRVNSRDQIVTTHGYNYLNYFILLKHIYIGNVEDGIDYRKNIHNILFLMNIHIRYVTLRFVTIFFHSEGVVKT